MSDHDKFPSVIFGDSSQSTNWILDSWATCHMEPEVSVFIPCLLEDTDNYRQTSSHGETKRTSTNKNCNNNEDPFIATLHNVVLAPDFCNRLFSIIMLLHSGNTCLFKKGFLQVVLCTKRKTCGYITT